MTDHLADHLAVTRTAEFDLSADELWALVSDGSRWADWMVDESDVHVTPGGTGTVVDDGVTRRVRVRSVSSGGFSSQMSSWTTGTATRTAGGRLVFEWQPVDDGNDEGAASTVEIEVTSTDDGGSRLRIVETSASAADAGFAWDLRLLAMCSCVAMCCRT
jgi:uncharacterized protein YndB with AHSA1/START domain